MRLSLEEQRAATRKNQPMEDTEEGFEGHLRANGPNGTVNRGLPGVRTDEKTAGGREHTASRANENAGLGQYWGSSPVDGRRRAKPQFSLSYGQIEEIRAQEQAQAVLHHT